MNKATRLIVLTIFATLQILTCNAENDCEGITVGECLAPVADIIQTIDIFREVQDCQFYCGALTSCELFRFNGTHCTLLTKDYRKDCQIFAGRFDKKIDECLEIDNKKTCDLFIEEDCGYTGDVLLEPPVGTVADPQQCKELCNQFTAIGCKYWVFSNTEKLCSLRMDEDRDCKTWGGPRSPSYDECKGATTLVPTTEAPTTM